MRYNFLEPFVCQRHLSLNMLNTLTRIYRIPLVQSAYVKYRNMRASGPPFVYEHKGWPYPPFRLSVERQTIYPPEGKTVDHEEQIGAVLFNANKNRGNMVRVCPLRRCYPLLRGDFRVQSSQHSPSAIGWPTISCWHNSKNLIAISWGEKPCTVD